MNWQVRAPVWALATVLALVPVQVLATALEWVQGREKAKAWEPALAPAWAMEKVQALPHPTGLAQVWPRHQYPRRHRR